MAKEAKYVTAMSLPVEEVVVEEVTASDGTEKAPEVVITSKRYEYVNANTGGGVDTFNRYGSQGWRVVTTEKGWTLFEREYELV